MGHGHGHHHDTSRAGLRALWISLLVLGGTAAVQAVIAVLSGSVALLGDTVHNVADALTAIPLGIAFLIGRRPATRTHTYGFGRAEDLAGLVVLLVIAASAVLAGVLALCRLVAPEPMAHVAAVAAAGIVGFAGNELVARYRIRVGRRIGSAALVADGLHARTDGFTSLAVVGAAVGALFGWQWADPVIGLAITVAIVAVLRGAAREVYRRMMDAVEPGLVDTVESALAATPGVRGIGAVRLRWIGHQLHAETSIVVDPELTIGGAHTIADAARRQLRAAMPRLVGAVVRADPDRSPPPS